jgi:hypothetical protein
MADRQFFKWVSVLLFFLLMGCSASYSVRPDQIVPEQFTIENNVIQSVYINVDGGLESKAGMLQVIRNRDFMQGLNTAIIRSGLFTKITTNESADYRLQAHIFDVNSPWNISDGIDYTEATVQVEIVWSLTHSATNVHWRKSIQTSAYEGANLLGYIGPPPSAIATERALKENIRSVIEEISKLKF